MLLVDGEPVLSSSGAVRIPSTRGCLCHRCVRFCPLILEELLIFFLQGGSGKELVAALAGYPSLRDVADQLKALPERRISAEEDGARRHVYLFQREYATVDPARVEVRGDGPCLCQLVSGFRCSMRD